MLTFTIVAILFFLAAQLLSIALGIDVNRRGYKAVLYMLSLAIGHVILFWIGFVLGDLFMHLMDGFKNIVLLLALFLTGIRMLMESFPVWKGERTYSIDSLKMVQFAGLAQGMNTFLMGLLFVFLPIDRYWLMTVLLIFTFLFSIIGLILKPTKNNITFAALFFVLGGLFLVFSSVYLGFFAL